MYSPTFRLVLDKILSDGDISTSTLKTDSSMRIVWDILRYKLDGEEEIVRISKARFFFFFLSSLFSVDDIRDEQEIGIFLSQVSGPVINPPPLYSTI